MTKDEAIKWLKVESSYIEENVGHGKEILEAYDMAIEALEEKRTATWDYVQYCSPKISNFHCSNCRHIAINHKLSEYCPHCGARMEVEE